MIVSYSVARVWQRFFTFYFLSINCSDTLRTRTTELQGTPQPTACTLTHILKRGVYVFVLFINYKLSVKLGERGGRIKWNLCTKWNFLCSPCASASSVS